MKKLIIIFILLFSDAYAEEKLTAQTPVKIENKMTWKWFDVRATRIGLIGRKTASGIIINNDSIFVALPSRKALYKSVMVQYKNKLITCKVLDVGPWNTKDDYWNSGNRPKSEFSKGNKAGIDLSDEVCRQLEIPRKIGIVWVKWRFMDE
ncbi:MAG: hypothetical protein AABY32_03960 [Nanoarchaeota archaeon]